MSERFKRAMPHILKHEGGYVNHPKDPGGATNMGVTQRTYASFLTRHGKPVRNVRNIADDEVNDIYKEGYWDAVRGDDLPSGVAYCVFDAAVNSGPGRAVRWLQRVIGAKQDGVVGNETLSLAAAMRPADLINAYCDIRLAFMRRLPHYPTFKGGWERRVRDVRAQAIAWASGAAVPSSTGEGQGKAEGRESVPSTILDAVKDPAAISTVTGLLGSVGALASGSGPIQWAVAAVLVLGAVAGLVWLMRRRET